MALYTSSCGKYKIEILKPETFLGAMTVIKDGFLPDEYVCIANEVNKDPEAVKQYMGYCAESVLDGISVVAVEIATGEVAAVVINKLQTENVQATFAKASEDNRVPRPSVKSMIKFSLDVDSRMNLLDLYETDCSFELMFVGTLSAHRGKHLAYLCCKASVDVAKMLKDGPVSKITIQDMGPDYSHLKPRETTKILPKICQILCSSVATQKIGKALGFVVHLRVSFTEFSYNGLNYVERNGFDPYLELQGLRLDL